MGVGHLHGEKSWQRPQPGKGDSHGAFLVKVEDHKGLKLLGRTEDTVRRKAEPYLSLRMAVVSGVL